MIRQMIINDYCEVDVDISLHPDAILAGLPQWKMQKSS